MKSTDIQPINQEDLQMRWKLTMREGHTRLAHFLFEQISGKTPQQSSVEDKKWVGKAISELIAKFGYEDWWVNGVEEVKEEHAE